MEDNPSSPPFSFPAGDVILRSADNVNFRVHTILLSLASPFFHDMFSLPQTSNELQTIQMTEKADVLVAILQLIYPFEEPASPYAGKLAIDVYKAADKLEITKVQPIARRRLCEWLDVLPNPLEAWAIAVRYDIPEAIARAKRHFISTDTKACLKEFPDYLRVVPTEKYAALISLKEATIQQGWERFIEVFTCLWYSGTSNPPFAVADCAYCIKFMHCYRSKTQGAQIFEQGFDTLHLCHKFAAPHKCVVYEARDVLRLKDMHLKLQNELSSCLMERRDFTRLVCLPQVTSLRLTHGPRSHRAHSIVRPRLSIQEPQGKSFLRWITS